MYPQLLHSNLFCSKLGTDCSSFTPEKFSEGLFIWIDNDQMMTTLEYHCAKGGDPEVYKKWEESNKAFITKKEI